MYDSTEWHRIIEGFMIQGGDVYAKNESQETEADRIPAEIVPGFYHTKGMLAAARQGDQVNPERASSGSQFYIVQGKPVPSTQLDRIAEQRSFTNSADTTGYTPEQIAIYQSIGGTPHLDGAYTVFGEVIEGLDVIDKIAEQEVDRRSRPLKDIKMSMKIIRKRWP
jgi:peptidyl-prolyl cis-trans isomerase B (cyclophilin B)